MRWTELKPWCRMLGLSRLAVTGYARVARKSLPNLRLWPRMDHLTKRMIDRLNLPALITNKLTRIFGWRRVSWRIVGPKKRASSSGWAVTSRMFWTTPGFRCCGECRSDAGMPKDVRAAIELEKSQSITGRNMARRSSRVVSPLLRRSRSAIRRKRRGGRCGGCWCDILVGMLLRREAESEYASRYTLIKRRQVRGNPLPGNGAAAES